MFRCKNEGKRKSKRIKLFFMSWCWYSHRQSLRKETFSNFKSAENFPHQISLSSQLSHNNTFMSVPKRSNNLLEVEKFFRRGRAYRLNVLIKIKPAGTCCCCRREEGSACFGRLRVIKLHWSTCSLCLRCMKWFQIPLITFPFSQFWNFSFVAPPTQYNLNWLSYLCASQFSSLSRYGISTSYYYKRRVLITLEAFIVFINN